MLITIQALFVVKLDLATYIIAVCIYILIYSIILFLKSIKFNMQSKSIQLINFYLLIGIIAIVKGFFDSVNYWEYKQVFLITGPVFLLPLVVFVGQNTIAIQLIFYNYIKFALPFSIVVYLSLSFSDNLDGLARYLSPIYFLILFYPIVNRKWKTLIFIVAIFSFFSDYGARSNMIRILASTICMLIFYFYKFLPSIIFKVIHFMLFALPLLLFLMATLNIFNIFKFGEYIKSDIIIEETTSRGERVSNDFKADTRTFLYEEVIKSVYKSNNWLFGEGASGGYSSEYFDSLGSKGRMGCEIGILNVFLYLGLIGVIIFTLIFYTASYHAIYNSNNILIKVIGLFISFRWTYSLVEEFGNFDMNYFFLWLMIGFCYSRNFQKMTDYQMKKWVIGIFEPSKSFKSKLNI